VQADALFEDVDEREVAAVGTRVLELPLQLAQLVAQAVVAILGDEGISVVVHVETHHARPCPRWAWGRDPILDPAPLRDAQTMQSRPRNPLPADALLVVVVASLLATVAAVWLMVEIVEGWAVVLALLIAITGVLSLMAVMSRELDESDDDEPASE
jgi:hypothetical protein